MTAREIKDINREISRLRAKMARIQAEADNTAVTLGERIVPSGQTSDRVVIDQLKLPFKRDYTEKGMVVNEKRR